MNIAPFCLDGLAQYAASANTPTALLLEQHVHIKLVQHKLLRTKLLRKHSQLIYKKLATEQELMVLSTTGRHILGCLKMTGARPDTNNFVMCKVIPLTVLSCFDKRGAVGMFAV